MPRAERPLYLLPPPHPITYNFNAITYFNVKNDSYVTPIVLPAGTIPVVACQHVFILYSDTCVLCSLVVLHYIVFIENDNVLYLTCL